MKIGIMQPYFLPYLGYFQLIKAVDNYVIYDDVNYIMRGWINRNNFLINGNAKIFTISLKGASPNKLINESEIDDDFGKFLRMIYYNYSKAPFFNNVFQLIEGIVEYEDKCLSRFITNCIKEICNYVNIRTNLLISSELPKDISLKGSDKVIDICKQLKADICINPIGGLQMYSKGYFALHGIDLFFLQTKETPYKQLNNNFVSGLSILDVLMFNSVEQVECMLDRYNLI
ncbi:WbqC-like protein family protein [Bacteroides luti]|jgi:hypothetical protein|uniref:WbqC-like protein family protein n=2 Tax=Bacteroides luti TaxID=1297750 RepID=A0A1M4W9A3_9BACE|nr:WbqC-like protein family protein [Bacteroides luti]